MEIKTMDFPPNTSKQLELLHEFLQSAVDAKDEKSKQWAIDSITKIHQLFLNPIIMVKDVDKNGTKE